MVASGATGFWSGKKGESSESASLRWQDAILARPREATDSELALLMEYAKNAAYREGYPQSLIEKAEASATVSVTPRGTDVGRCALILDETSVLLYTCEFEHGPMERYVVQTFLVEDERVMREVWPNLHGQALMSRNGGGENESDIALASLCCDPSGAAVGTCCEYDFQGMFECCGPCAWAIPSPPAFIACVLIWCQYCAAAYCRRWYSSCV